nr:Chain E, cQYN meditope [synthetic construct]4GW5_F Chain F, cQYN meditope [synthetic construct]
CQYNLSSRALKC